MYVQGTNSIYIDGRDLQWISKRISTVDLSAEITSAESRMSTTGKTRITVTDTHTELRGHAIVSDPFFKAH
jgi:hypothetical protein